MARFSGVYIIFSSQMQLHGFYSTSARYLQSWKFAIFFKIDFSENCRFQEKNNCICVAYLCLAYRSVQESSTEDYKIEKTLKFIEQYN